MAISTARRDIKSLRRVVVVGPDVLPPGSSVQVPAMHILSMGEEAMLKREQNLHAQ